QATPLSPHLSYTRNNHSSCCLFPDRKIRLSVGMFYSPLWVTRPPAVSSQNDALFNVRALLTYQLKWA
ncbi:hypothetical protein, partial [uncultured Nitrosomonas sp.]|uniref:hypothetical protein n=1 Tax=uncultured Nitrosomonas sp. TaxID=156424 RepID=UPI0025E2508C